MTTFVFPGGSANNKEWATQTKELLATKIPTVVISCKHWETGETEPNWIDVLVRPWP